MSAQDHDFSDHGVLVTGGGRGVGLGIAEEFLARGAQVVICGRSEPESLPSSDGRTAVFVAGDVRKPDSAAGIVDAAVAAMGRLDVVVNNAGGSPPGFVSDVSPRFLSAIVELNLLGPLYIGERANAVMQTQTGGGVIINIASVNAIRPSPGTAAYGAAKAGLLSLTESLAVEWAPRVRVNAVTAGIVATEQLLTQYYDNDPVKIQQLADSVPLGRLALPSDIANACVFLASPLASHISGSNLLVHGGGEPPDSLPERSAPA